MNTNFKEINKKVEEVNKLAKDMVKYKPGDRAALKLIEEIMELLGDMFYKMPGGTDKYGNTKHFFPLLNKYVLDEVFNETLIKLLGEKKEKLEDGESVKKWYFNPKFKPERETPFVDFFKFKLKKEMQEFYRKLGQQQERYGVTISIDDDEGGIQNDIEDPGPKPGDEIEDEITASEHFGKILDIYAKNLHTSARTPKEKERFPAFFTFDTTKAVKACEEYAETAYRHNDKLFYLMVISLLEFLMFGKFAHMKDVIVSELREDNIDKEMKKRGEALAKYFTVSTATISNFNITYEELKKSIINEKYLQ